MSSAFDQPRTPDFAHYTWDGLTSAQTADDWVTCRWPDGTEHAFYGLWLWENTVGRGTDPTTREMTIDPGDLPDPPIIASVAIDEHCALIVEWSETALPRDQQPGGTDRLHPGWLRSVGDGLQRPDRTLPAPSPWSLATWALKVDQPGASAPPSVDGGTVLEDDTVLAEWLELAVTYGIARLVGVPSELDFLDLLSERIGPIRATNFGRLFSVRSIVEPTAEENSLANTGLKLGQHSDLPSRETPPGFQLLHCVENTVPGGWATFTDGAELTEFLRREHPDDFDALTTLRWTFVNRSPDADHRWSGTMIELGTGGRPLTLRCFYPVRAVPDMDPVDVPRAYAAMRTFSSISRYPNRTLRFPYAPGDLVIFDNRRVLHGRDSFDPGGGERHLRGCYYDHDDVYSRLRVLRRSLVRASGINTSSSTIETPSPTAQ